MLFLGGGRGAVDRKGPPLVMATPERPLPARASVPFLVLVLVSLLVPCAVQAQLPYIDPIPWHTPADSTSRLAMLAEVQRFTDSHTSWSGNRFLLTVLLPAGDKGTFFLRFPHLPVLRI